MVLSMGSDMLGRAVMPATTSAYGRMLPVLAALAGSISFDPNALRQLPGHSEVLYEEKADVTNWDKLVTVGAGGLPDLDEDPSPACPNW